MIEQQILRQDRQQLIAQNGATMAIDHNDPVAITIKGHTEIEMFARDQSAKI